MTPRTDPLSLDPAADASLESLAIHTLRFLAVDAVEQAKSGHPGMPMGMADAAYVLWTRFLRHQPQDPGWPNRDRFVLSAGHGSMLLYGLLHLTGYDLPMTELQRFRQLKSRTPGHPEQFMTPGVETTTGPLGQGFGNGVGMALAGRMLSARFNDGDFAPFDYRVYGIVSDGDLMEGVASEAASLAGHWGLGNLIYLYDDNHISIEGSTDLAFTEDVGKRFEAYGWRVDTVDAYDRPAIAQALQRAVAQHDRPSLIVCRSVIGYGAPEKQGTREAHGEPLGAAQVAAAKQHFGWPESPTFLVPDGVYDHWRRRPAELRPEYDAWQASLARWLETHPGHAELWRQHVERAVPSDLFDRLCAEAPTGAGATRAHSGAVLQIAASRVPALVGGSADLEPSTKTFIKGRGAVQKGDYSGSNLHFGVREHGMGSILNGMALNGGFIPYGASFLVFTDYCRPAIRLSALMREPVIWVFTHVSIFLGEDGPTHQPVEHLATLRLIPNLLVIRPADGLETAAAWGMALERPDGPTLLALTRQNLPPIERPAGFDPRELRRGATLLRDGDRTAPTLIATGSEVHLAVAAAERLAAAGIATRVVSMPAPQRFLEQDQAWRDQVLPPGAPRVTIEAGATAPWWRFTGERDLRIGIDRFGESAPLKPLQEHFGFTPEAVEARVRAWLSR